MTLIVGRRENERFAGATSPCEPRITRSTTGDLAMSIPIHRKSAFRARRPSRPTKVFHRTRPTMDELEDRCLLAFDLHNGILRETFDEQAVTPQQLYAGWDDDEYVPATTGFSQSPQLVLPAIPLFHHQVTNIPNGSLYNDAAAGTLPNQGDTTIADNPFIPRALNLFEVTDAITFPDINPQNNEAVSIAELDVERESYGQTVSATFVGTGDSETLTDTNQYNSAAPPAVIVAIQGSSGSGPIGVVGGAPTTPGWDTLAATSDDIGIHGKSLGPITEIDLLSVNSETIDNVRIFVSFSSNGSGPTPPVASSDLYELPANTTPGTSFASTQIAVASVSSASVLANDTSGSGAQLTAQLVSGPKHDPSFKLKPDGTFTYVPDSTYNATDQSTDSFTYVATDGTDTSDVATVTIVTKGGTEDSDGDGVPDSVEALGPSDGDANKDGIPDYLEPAVASLLGADGEYWTITTSSGSLKDVHDSPLNPSLPATPNPVPVQVCVPGSTGQLTCSNQISLYIQ